MATTRLHAIDIEMNGSVLPALLAECDIFGGSIFVDVVSSSPEKEDFLKVIIL